MMVDSLPKSDCSVISSATRCESMPPSANCDRMARANPGTRSWAGGVDGEEVRRFDVGEVPDRFGNNAATNRRDEAGVFGRIDEVACLKSPHRHSPSARELRVRRRRPFQVHDLLEPRPELFARDPSWRRSMRLSRLRAWSIISRSASWQQLRPRAFAEWSAASARLRISCGRFPRSCVRRQLTL